MPERRRRQARFSSLSLILCIAATACEPTAVVEGKRSASPRALARQALVSIYHEAAGREGDERIFLPLEQATGILVKEHDTELAGSRRIRAAVRLAGGSRFLGPPSGGIEPPEFGVAMRQLVGDEAVDEIAQRIVAERTPQSAESNRAIAQAVLGSGFADCTYDATTAVLYQEDTQVTTGITVFRIDRSLDHVAKAMDPRGWAICSDFFPAVYIPKKNAAGEAEQTDCGAVPDPNANEVLGGTWTDVVFERFEPGLGAETFFTNLLPIATDRQTDSYQMDYALGASLCSRIAAYETQHRDGGIQVDWGGATATADSSSPSHSNVRALKRLRLGPRLYTVPLDDLREWTVTSMEALGDEVPAAVCCNQP